jgi:hypothetical protein
MKFYIRFYQLAFWINIQWLNKCIVFDGMSKPKRMSYSDARYLTDFRKITL